MEYPPPPPTWVVINILNSDVVPGLLNEVNSYIGVKICKSMLQSNIFHIFPVVFSLLNWYRLK